MKLASGRSFTESFSKDKEACLINESVAKKLILADPLKARFIQPGDPKDRSTFLLSEW